MPIVKTISLFLLFLFMSSCDPHGNANEGNCGTGCFDIDMGNIIKEEVVNCDSIIVAGECFEEDDRERLPPEDDKPEKQDPEENNGEPIPGTDPDKPDLPEYNPNKDKPELPEWDFNRSDFGKVSEGLDHIWGEVTGKNAKKRRKARRAKKLADEINDTVNKIEITVDELKDLVGNISINHDDMTGWQQENADEAFNQNLTSSGDSYNGSIGNVVVTVPDVELDYGNLPDGSAAIYPEHAAVIRTQQYINTVRNEVEAKYAGHSSYGQRMAFVNAAQSASEVADEAYRNGNPIAGDFAQKLALGAADLAIGLTPGLSWANDVYSVFTGKSLLGEELSGFDYGMAVLGVVTAGYGSKLKYIKYADEAFDVVGKVIKKAGSMADLTKALEKNKKAKEVFENMYTKLPRSDGHWSGEAGFSKWFSDNPKVKAITGAEGVEYKGLFPQFETWVDAGNSKIFDGLVGDNAKDFTKVKKWIKDREKLDTLDAAEQWWKSKGLTPHHVEDGRTIQLVPTELHNAAKHIGGAALLRKFGTPTK